MGYQRLSRGNVMAGTFIGQVAAASIQSSEILAGEVLSSHLESLVINSATLITSGVVTNAKRTKTCAVITPVAAVGVLPATNGTYHITCAGATNVVVTAASTATLDTPTAGDWYNFYVDIAANSSVSTVEVKSISATFDGTNDVMVFSGPSTKGATSYYASIQAVSGTRWLVLNESTGVTLAATT